MRQDSRPGVQLPGAWACAQGDPGTGLATVRCVDPGGRGRRTTRSTEEVTYETQSPVVEPERTGRRCLLQAAVDLPHYTELRSVRDRTGQSAGERLIEHGPGPAFGSGQPVHDAACGSVQRLLDAATAGSEQSSAEIGISSDGHLLGTWSALEASPVTRTAVARCGRRGVPNLLKCRTHQE